MLGKKSILSVSILFILTGIFLRLYQLNFENYWLDELVDFWVADPNITLHATFVRRELVDDQTPYLFQLFLKIYLKFFGYDSEIGRHVPLIFGVLSIPLVGILSYQVAKNNSFLLTILLVSINIYLIKYSQETRAYTLVFLLCTINLIFYYKIIFSDLTYFKKNIYFFLICYFFCFRFIGTSFCIYYFFFANCLFCLLFFCVQRKRIFYFFYQFHLS